MQSEAMTLAMEAFRAPSRFRQKQSLVVPIGMLVVIKAAAGDDTTIAELADAFKAKEEDIREAARHYLLHYLLKAETRGVRLLGLTEQASEAEMKDHKRWLLKWLHPDRNPSVWEQKLFHRISDVRIDKTETLSTVQNNVISSKPHVSRRRRMKNRRMAVDERRKDSSLRRIVLRFLRPLLLGSVVAFGLVWTFVSNGKLPDFPLNVLTLLSRG